MQGIKHFITVCLAIAPLAGCSSSGGDSGPPLTPPPPPPPPPAAPSIDVQAAFPNVSFAAPVSMVQAPGDALRWFVVEQAGIIRVFDNDPNVNSTSVFLDITGRVTSGGERGLLGIAFHPQYPSTPEVFVNYTTGSAITPISRVSRFLVNQATDTLDPASEEILFVVPQLQGNHNGGDLAFGPNGLLYASFGDGGGGGDPGGNGQNTSTLLGTIVRIDVDSAGLYDIPPDNPFASTDLCATGPNSGVPCPEIYAWGLRNPWRISFDLATGNLWIGDVGQGAWEEVDRIDASQAPNDRNFGWNDREGAHCYPPGTQCTVMSLDPVTEYDRSLGASITGGYVYRGSAVPDLSGRYVFGDFVSGRIFATPADSQPTVTPEVLLDTGLSISTFAEDVDGELYVIDYGGNVFSIVAAP